MNLCTYELMKAIFIEGPYDIQGLIKSELPGAQGLFVFAGCILHGNYVRGLVQQHW